MGKIILTTISSEELKKLITDSVAEVFTEFFPAKSKEISYDFLNIKEASKLLNIAPQTIYGYTSKRTIPFFKRSKRLYFSKEDLLAWVREGKMKTQSEIEQVADDYIQGKNERMNKQKVWWIVN